MTKNPSPSTSVKRRRAPVVRPYLRQAMKQTEAPKRRDFTGVRRFLTRISRGAVWLVIAILILLLTVALATYSPADPGFSISMHVDQVENWLGRTGAWISDALIYMFGVSSWWLVVTGVFSLLSLALGSRRSDKVREQERGLSWIVSIIGFVCLMFGSCCLERFLELGVYGLLPAGPGGVVGHFFSRPIVHTIGVYPAMAVFLVMVILGASLLFRFSWMDICERIGTAIDTVLHWGSIRRAEAEDRRIGEQVRQEKSSETLPVKHEVSIEKAPAAATPEAEHEDVAGDADESSAAEAPKRPATRPSAPIPLRTDLPAGPRFPLSVLDPPDPEVDTVDEDSLALTCRLIESKLKSFGIDAAVVAARPGPVITQFEIQPGEGVKGSRIADVCDDLGRALGVGNLRIVMSLPGTTSMGLEMPSANRQTVRISEILASEEFTNSKSKLSLALGKDIAGNPYVVDLAKMPHLLVAGTTGSGKSVGINAMILSILYRSTPDEVRFVMIDPKMVEFSPYEGIPNLLCPVVTDMSKAVNALQWLTREMNRRYSLMRRVGVKRFEAFNEKVKEAEEQGRPISVPSASNPDEMEELKPWPYIVVVVDELADLILVGSRREVEVLITSLAQKARAAGIHLILATQRPSTDVVTPLIKANIPAHIAFQVVTRYDSQVIMGEPGAENLIGNGDMLFRVPGMSSMVRLQGCYVSDHDVDSAVAELKKYGSPEYVDDVMEKVEPEAGPTQNGGESDALYDKAVEIVLSTKRPTISSVQRHLSIGYNRAANLIEAMEKADIVSAPDSSGKRTILTPVGPD